MTSAHATPCIAAIRPFRPPTPRIPGSSSGTTMRWTTTTRASRGRACNRTSRATARMRTRPGGSTCQFQRPGARAMACFESMIGLIGDASRGFICSTPGSIAISRLVLARGARDRIRSRLPIARHCQTQTDRYSASDRNAGWQQGWPHIIAGT